jgi:hypothetical protein
LCISPHHETLTQYICVGRPIMDHAIRISNNNRHRWKHHTGFRMFFFFRGETSSFPLTWVCPILRSLPTMVIQHSTEHNNKPLRIGELWYICLLHPLTKNTKNRWTLIPTNADGNNTRKIKEQATWNYAEYGYTTNPNLKFYYWIFHHINILIKTCITTLQGCLYTNKKSQTKLKK